MKFCELLKLLRKILPSKTKNQPDFLCYLFNLFLDSPDQQDDDPLFSAYPDFPDKSTATKLFNGTRKLQQEIANYILTNRDKSKFIDVITDLPTDTLEALKDAFVENGLYYPKPVSDKSFPFIIADIVIAFLDAATKKKAEVDLHNINTLELLAKMDDKHRVPLGLSEFSPTDNVISIGNEHIQLPPGLTKPTDIQKNTEAPYVNALLEIYTERLNHPYSLDNLNELPTSCKRHLEKQRCQFYSSESLARIARETFSDGEQQFECLEKEAYEGIEPTYNESCPNGKERLNRVQAKITSTTLCASKLSNIVGLINNETKKGLCHKLVNDHYIKSWVNNDEDF